jgi:putative acetyltransferase
MNTRITTETPLQDEVRTLVAELNAVLLELTPPEHCHHLTVEQMADADTTVFIARDGGAAVACGALKRHEGGIGEVKRMYTRPRRGTEASRAGDRRPSLRGLESL